MRRGIVRTEKDPDVDAGVGYAQMTETEEGVGRVRSVIGTRDGSIAEFPRGCCDKRA